MKSLGQACWLTLGFNSGVSPRRPGIADCALPGFGVSSQTRIVFSSNSKFDGQPDVSIEFVSSLSLSLRGETTYVDQKLSLDEAAVEQVGLT